MYSDGRGQVGGAWANVSTITEGNHFKVNHKIHEWVSKTTGNDVFFVFWDVSRMFFFGSG